MRYFSFFRFTALFGKGGEERLLAASQNALRDASPRDEHNEQPDWDRKGMEKFQSAVTEEPAAQR